MVDVFVALGAAIVKAGVKVWLKDNDFAADAGASLTDLISGRISNEYDRRKARNIFENLEIPVAKRLKSLGEAEFGNLPQNEWNAAVIAAGDTFGRSQLTAAELFTRDLDPLFLERHIRKGNPRATSDLSEGGAGLYDRLISEGCAYVIEIADKLPHFHAGAFAELLHRDRQIVDLITEVLDRIPSQTEGRDEESRFLTACRRHIATKLDRLTLLGLDFESSWYQLTVAYVSLRAQEDGGNSTSAWPSPENTQVLEAPAGAGKDRWLRSWMAEADRPPVEHRLAYSPRLLLLGRAGSGKTTVLQWLAVNAARGSFTGPLAGFNGYFPFYLRLREYREARLPAPEQFLASVAPLLVDEAPNRRWASRQLDSGHALLLVDGVDEVPDANRAAVDDWLRSLLDLYPAVRCVVTSRPEAVEAGWLADAGFESSSLEPMPPSLVQSFICKWHEAARLRQPDDEERARLDGYEKVLQAAVTDDRYLRDLADTPLLAGLLCALNMHLQANLPHRRTEIYQRALAMFDQRERARGLVPDEPALDLTRKTQVLADLALWMVRNGQTETDFASADAQLRRSFAALGTGRPTPPEGVLGRYLMVRSGLLREPVAGRVDFVHRTFQEYLAAKAAIETDSIGELAKHAGNDQWGEIVVLAAGQANQVQAGRLLKDLLRNTWRGRQRHGRQVLAVAGLREVQRVDEAVRREVEAVIPELLPPRTMIQAEQLAASGPPLIALLAGYWKSEPALVAQTIRAASLVGGASAMELIGDIVWSMANDPYDDRSMMAELPRAWQYFDTEEFARRVLARAQVTTLHVSEPSQLSALRLVPSLRDLTVGGNGRGVIDMSAFAGLSQITHLTLVGTHQSFDLDLLRWCPQIASLTLWNYQGADLLSLPRLPELSALEISAGLHLRSLWGIGQFARLSSLRVSDCAELAFSWDPFVNLPGLKEVRLSGPAGVDLSAFRSRGPMTLYLFGCGDVDISPLAKSGLVELFVDDGTRVQPNGLPNVALGHRSGRH